MKRYRVIIECEPVPMQVEGPDGKTSEKVFGFYATQYVSGRSEAIAEYRAIAQEWDDWVKHAIVPEELRSAVGTTSFEIHEIGWTEYLKGVGRRFFRGVRGRTFYRPDDKD